MDKKYVAPELKVLGSVDELTLVFVMSGAA
jgi:hypothetical protein